MDGLAWLAWVSLAWLGLAWLLSAWVNLGWLGVYGWLGVGLAWVRLDLERRELRGIFLGCAG